VEAAVNQLTVQRRSDRPAAATGRQVPHADAPAAPEGTPAPVEPGAGRRPGARTVLVLGVAVTLGVLVVASLVGGAAAPQALGDPGPVTRWGLLVTRTVYDVAAIGTLGVLAVAVLLLPRVRGELGPEAQRLVGRVSRWAGVWSVTALVSMLFTLSEVAGRSVPAVLDPGVLPLALQLETTRALLSSAWLAMLVAVGARSTRSPASGMLLFLTAVGAVVLPLLTGHAGHGDAPAVTATSLALHVVGAAVWVGGLAALVVHLRRADGVLAVALPRFSRLALGCYVLVGLSGVVTAWASLTTLDQLWTTPYGRLLLGKVALLGVLGAFGHRHRRRTVTAAALRRPRAFVHLAAAEVVLMACAAALAVALSHTAPPPEPAHGATASGVVAAVVAR
jgi:putative copper export protein